MNVVINGNKGILEPAEGESKGAILFLHGRSGRHNSALMKRLAESFPDFWTLRTDFNFIKTKQVSENLVDELDEAKEMLAFLLRRANCPASKCIIVGKSLGAFIASKMVTKLSIKGVVLLSYLLHEKNHPSSWFPQEHFRSIRKPILLLAGDKDPFCNISMARALKSRVNKLDLVVCEHADQNFKPTNDAKTQEQNYQYSADIIRAWWNNL